MRLFNPRFQRRHRNKLLPSTYRSISISIQINFQRRNLRPFWSYDSWHLGKCLLNYWVKKAGKTFRLLLVLDKREKKCRGFEEVSLIYKDRIPFFFYLNYTEFRCCSPRTIICNSFIWLHSKLPHGDVLTGYCIVFWISPVRLVCRLSTYLTE